jgi:predicted O-methyltransferase YrrM
MTGDGESSLIEDIIQKVEGYMHKNECYALYNLAKIINKNCIVEIGSHKGRSSCCLGIAAKQNNIKVYSIDIWENYNKMQYATEWGIKTFVNESIYQIYLNNLNLSEH